LTWTQQKLGRDLAEITGNLCRMTNFLFGLYKGGLIHKRIRDRLSMIGGPALNKCLSLKCCLSTGVHMIIAVLMCARSGGSSHVVFTCMSEVHLFRSPCKPDLGTSMSRVHIIGHSRVYLNVDAHTCIGAGVPMQIENSTRILQASSTIIIGCRVLYLFIFLMCKV
jgi:hypothetical protein